MSVYISDGGSISKVRGPKPMNRFSLPIIKAGSGVASPHFLSSVFFSVELI